MSMTENIESLFIEDSMKDSYLRYSMSVIVSRALPDVRDGLKPVHRRVLYGMHDLGVYPSKGYKKSARIVGDVIGKYHPHGDSAVYDTLVRMAQDFSLRYPMVDGQGNFGSVDGDSPAAMRYTEARMARYAEMMLEEIDKETVDYVNNYDETESEPSVLPAAFPNLIVNGSTGIAVGMATNMAPHNMTEVINATKAYIENPDIEPEELINHVSGPDFPTGGIIHGRAGIRSAYLTGRGRVTVRSRHHIEQMANGKERIVVTEIPYQVNKANLLEKIAGLVREKRVEGITDLRDESDRDGMRIVIELRRDVMHEVILNHLYKYTQLQDNFSIYNLALVRKQPTLLTLKDMIRHYVDHRHEIVVRKTEFERAKAAARAHILEGLRIAQANIDEVVKLIKASASQDEAKKKLQETFELSDIQADKVVAMRLGQLTQLDVDKIENEYQELMILIADLEDILANKPRRMAIIVERLDEVLEKFGDTRRTSIEEALDDIDIEDLIPNDPMVISLSNTGYIKRMPVDTYKAQGRGGVGVTGSKLKEEDFVKSLFVASNHSFLLVFTDLGRVHWMKVFHIPEVTRQSRGKAIVNMIDLQENENVSAIVPVSEFTEGHYIMMATKNGTINKMDVNLFSRPRKGGVNAITLDEGDTLVTALAADLNFNLMLATADGQSIVFEPSAFRAMGRGTRGVRGIRLGDDDHVISMLVLEGDKKVFTVTEHGYGKRSEIVEYRVTNRGGKGIRNIKISEKTGRAVNVSAVEESSDLIVTTKNGTIIRTPVADVSTYGRSSQGVRVIRLRESDAVMDVAILKEEYFGSEDELVEAAVEIVPTLDADGNVIEAEVVLVESDELAETTEPSDSTESADDSTE